ncbi:Saccharopine dehydrogenase-domain-containing protein [Bombardia bombarda]|uniref:Saccharopine dehydrogenase-domain-containing protein n=1 Tax=Bombardia bombarda TaxID=252184 RepID=A0AA39WTX8_9PEZI|nr:Saccharopine dehydrogenase-domain-containing protein [Bombardia bombarda]
MPSKQHGRQYDLIVFGASGYTGKYTAQHIATHLPTDLKWAVAGRSRDKLEQVIAQCNELNSDRRQPEIEICSLNDAELARLAKKTLILITTVGPYGKLGEHAFKACAENGTHYLDVTGEVPFVARMVRKYEDAAKSSGAMMFPQIGIESAPSDLITWALASKIRSELSAKTRDVTVSIHTFKAAPSGGTLATAFSILENFTISEYRDCHKPFALSPIPNPAATTTAAKPSLFTRITGLATYPILGLQTTSLAGSTDAAIVERTWGLLSSTPPLRDQSYGPRFSFKQHMKPRNWLTGAAFHFSLMILGIVMVTPFLRRLVLRYGYQPGEGPDPEQAARDQLEYRAIAKPDLDGGAAPLAGAVGEGGKEYAYCRAWYNGSMYYLTGVLLAEAAATILDDGDDDAKRLPGGIYTAACLGQLFIDRLDRAGFHFETKVLSA